MKVRPNPSGTSDEEFGSNRQGFWHSLSQDIGRLDAPWKDFRFLFQPQNGDRLNLGTRGLLTLELHAKCDGIAAECDALSVTYKKTDLTYWRPHLDTSARGDRTALDLAHRMNVKTFDKFDDVLAEELLDEANARDRLDLPGARLRAEQAIDILATTAPP